MGAHSHGERGRTHRRIWVSSAVAGALVSWAAVVGGTASAGTTVDAGTLNPRSQPNDADHESKGHIVWSRFVDLDFSAARIMVSDSSGEHRRPLTHPPEGVVDVDPKISPDGRHVVFGRDFPDGTSQVVIVGINGRAERPLDLGCVDPCLVDTQPTWAPDGHHLLFQRVIGPIHNNNAGSARLWKSDLAGEHIVPVSKPRIDGRFEDTWAQFAPAGYLVFVRLSLARDAAAVFRMDPDGSNACRLTPWSLNADLPDVSPATSGPTKNLAVFETYGHGGPPPGKASAIATTPATCGGEHHIRYLTSPTSDPVWHFNPGWSPDGRHVVFVRFKFVDGDPIVHGDIVTSRWNGEHRKLIARSPLFDFRPDWGPAPREDNDLG